MVESGRLLSRYPAVEVNNLSVSYGSSTALSGVDLLVEQGDFLGIIGPNGGGKSTLLKALVGLVEPERGSVLVNGLNPLSARHIIGYVPQSTIFDHQFPVAVREVVLTGRLKKGFVPFHRFNKKDNEIVDQLLEKVGMTALQNRQISELSGGEFQKMLIARALATEPQILLLDEPTASVDVHSSSQIYSLLKELNRRITIILVTHDLSTVAAYVKKLACLNNHLFYHGEAEINQEIIGHLYGCPVDILTHDHIFVKLRKHGDEKE